MASKENLQGWLECLDWVTGISETVFLIETGAIKSYDKFKLDMKKQELQKRLEQLKRAK